MDILRVLSLADLEVRKKTLELVLDLITSKNIDEVSLIIHPFVSTICPFVNIIHPLLDCADFEERSHLK